MAGLPFYFAWGDEDDAFDASKLVVDEDIVEARFTHDEGDFATLEVVVRNPRVGLLAPGRPLWVWFSYNPNHTGTGSPTFADVIPLFKGRVVGIPPDLVGEVCTLTFLARPSDYEDQKAALATTLRVAPFWDPVWFDPDDALDPDNVLESRNARWHIDPVTHVVSVSSITTGEDGTIAADDTLVPYDSVAVDIGTPPYRRVDVNLTVNWDQVASAQQPVFSKVIPTYTGQGFLDSWPEPGRNIGSGWTVGTGSSAERIDGLGPDAWIFDYGGVSNVDSDYVSFEWKSGGKGVYVPPGAKKWVVYGHTYPAHVFVMRKNQIACTLTAQFDAKRGKTENVYYSLTAATQDVTTDDTDPRVKQMNFSSAEVVSPIDAGGAMPIGAAFARSYLNTDRGARSIEYTLMCARAQLIASARCVDVAFEVPFDYGMSENYTLRKSAVLEDYRLPGGIAAGKVTSVSWSISDSGDNDYTVKFGATVGLGGEVEEVVGEGEYADPGYMASGYQKVDGQYSLPESGDVAYESINGAPITDDGIVFTADKVMAPFVVPPTVTFAAPEQEPFIQSADKPETVIKNLNDNAVTQLTMQFKPLNSGPFVSEWTFATTQLEIAKTIDLEAEAASEP